MLFGLKKFISQFLMPIPLVCECFLLGWVLVRFTKYKKTGKVFSFLALLLFLLFGYGYGRTYLYNLERRYPPFDPLPEECQALRGASIVVLGQGMPQTSDLPVRYQNNEVFERRLFEAFRIAKLIPESRLIISMAGEGSDSVKQTFLDEYMALVNFPTNRVAMFTTARDTTEEAKLARQVISNQCSVVSNQSSYFRTLELPRRGVASSEAGSNFRTPSLILTTSASHLPRAIRIFQKQGMNPIPAPCDYTDVAPPEMEWKTWYQFPLPNGEMIEHSERALHEWLGNAYERLTH